MLPRLLFLYPLRAQREPKFAFTQIYIPRIPGVTNELIHMPDQFALAYEVNYY